jgi:transposase
MGQRARILTQIAGFTGWKVTDAYWEDAAGSRFEQVGCYDVPRDSTLVLVMGRRWAPRCGQCFAVVPGPPHQRREPRRWADLPWAERRVVIEYGPERLKCRRCGSHATELLGWADAKQRQTRRLQHHLALDAFSMPLVHVSTKYGLSWHTVRRAEYAAIERWESTRPIVPLLLVGVDEKWLGRRHKNPHKYVTIVSNLETGEPVWIGYGRSAETLKSWFATLTPEQKSAIRLFAMDMHRPFLNAVREDPVLRRIPVVHDPFHIMKRAGEALTELRREVFFRAGPELRAIGRGTRWLVLRAWEKSTEEQRVRLQAILALNPKLARAYQVVEELRETLRAPDAVTMMVGLRRILRRTQRWDNVPMRKLHDSIIEHYGQIVALGEHRPPTGRIEALNNNWETLVRRGRGYRDHQYLLKKLRFVVANPVRNGEGTRRFLALGLRSPVRMAA